MFWKMVNSPSAVLRSVTQAFARLGSKVTQVEMLPRILAREDP